MHCSGTSTTDRALVRSCEHETRPHTGASTSRRPCRKATACIGHLRAILWRSCCISSSCAVHPDPHLNPSPCSGTFGELSVTSLAELLADGEAAANVQLLDVREEGEHQAASIPGFRLLPLSRSASSNHAGYSVHALCAAVCQPACLRALSAGRVHCWSGPQH